MTLRTLPLLAALLLVDSLHFIFARALRPHLPPTTSAFLVLLTATVEIGVYLALRRQLRLALLRTHLGFFAAVGFLVAASTTINYAAVTYIDPGTATLLAQISTVFALGFGLFWLKERLRRAEWAGALLCIGGALVITFQPGDFLRFGALLVLASNFMYALHAAIVKRYGGEMEFANFFFLRVASTSLFLFIFTAVGGTLRLPPLPAWPIIVAAGTVDVVVSRMLYYWVLRRMRFGILALVLTLTPLIAIGYALLLFGERPTAQALWGGLLVLAGVTLVSLASGFERRQLARPPLPPGGV